MYGDFVHFDSLIDLEVISKVLFAYEQSNKSKRKDWESQAVGILIAMASRKKLASKIVLEGTNLLS